MTLEEIKTQAVGHWESLSVEVRPSNSKNEDGSAKPFYLKRSFRLTADDAFGLRILNFADPFGKVPLAELYISGHITWQGTHPVAEGAQKVDFAADAEYTVKPLLPAFADILNKYTTGFAEWRLGETQNIFKKAFPPFGLAEGQIFKEFDLIFSANDLLFWGARHVDGRGFDTEVNRPTSLQIPMGRVK